MNSVNIIKTFTLLILLNYANSYGQGNENKSKCFRAAVYEEVAVGNNYKNPIDEITHNINVYQHVTMRAVHKGADIIVFPEHGLFPPSDRDSMLILLEQLPNEMGVDNACTSGATSKPIQYTLSCLARKHQIYIVANMGEVEYCNQSNPRCPKDGRFQYNVAVAFDSNGFLVAKY
ncbi:pantetheinase-like isoform X2, partial [Leptotrombidium deliense]